MTKMYYNVFMDKIIIAIGGGEIREKETAEIDEQIASLAKKHAGDKRANALFIGTASHDSMPYYNSFHKTYTGLFELKTDCVLTVYGEMNDEKIRGKFEKADMIYVGGGDTMYMLEKWKESGVDKLIKEAYDRGVIICGLSAGAICWFEEMFTDSAGEEYEFKPALGYLKGGACPHYDDRKEDFFAKSENAEIKNYVCIENLSAVLFINGEMVSALKGSGNSYSVNISAEEAIFTTIPKKDLLNCNFH